MNYMKLILMRSISYWCYFILNTALMIQDTQNTIVFLKRYKATINKCTSASDANEKGSAVLVVRFGSGAYNSTLRRRANNRHALLNTDVGRRGTRTADYGRAPASISILYNFFRTWSRQIITNVKIRFYLLVVISIK